MSGFEGVKPLHLSLESCVVLSAFSMSSSRRLSFEDDSFTRFTVDMMRQYMKEDEIRAKHQVRQPLLYSVYNCAL